MKPPRAILIALVAAVVAALLLLQHRVASLEAKIERLTASDPAVKALIAPPGNSDDVEDDAQPLKLRIAAEVEPHFESSLKNKDIQAYARALLEANEWLFEPSEQQAAEASLSARTEALRVWIKSAVERLVSLAVASEKGADAIPHLKEATSVFSLYPQPDTDERQREAEALANHINDATRRVDELRRLRYNQWAITRIEDGVRQFHDNKKVGPDAVVTACVNALVYIDPAHLDPTVMDLYHYLVQITREKAGDAYFSRIAKGLTDPAVSKRTPINFDQ